MTTTGKRLYERQEYLDGKGEWELSDKLSRGNQKELANDESILAYHPIERDPNNGTKVRKIRVDRTKYLNLHEIVTSLLVGYLFKKPIDLDPATEKMLGDDVDNIDGHGLSLNNFMKNRICVPYLTFGKLGIRVVMPPLKEGMTKQDEGDFRPYWETISPLQIKDWQTTQSLSATSQFDFIRYEYIFDPIRTTEEQEPERYLYSRSYRKTPEGIMSIIWKGDKLTIGATGTKVVQGNFNKESETLLDIDEIPLVVLDDISWMKDCNHEIVRHYNKRSEHDNILANAIWPKVFIEVDNMSDVADMQGYMNENIWNIVKGRVVQLPPFSLQDHRDAIQDALTSVFRIGLNQSRFIADQSKQVEGADSQVEQKENTRTLAESLLQDIEQLGNRALNIHAKFKGQDNFTGKMNLNKEFNEFNYNKFAQIYGLVLRDLTEYPEARDEIIKSMIKKLGEELGDVVLDETLLTKTEATTEEDANPFEGVDEDTEEPAEV